MRKVHRSARTACVRALIAAAALFAFAGTALANFEISITPNPLQIQAGKSADITINTENQGLPPEAATIEYSIMGIHPSGGGPEIRVATKSLPAMGPAFPPVTLSIPVVAGTAPGDYAGSIVGLVKDAQGGIIGPKEFKDVLHVEVQQGEASGPCLATVEPAAIELTRDFKPKEATLHVSRDCSDAQVIAAFAMLGHGINADACNVKLAKQADGSYPDAKFVIRASQTADAPPEGIDWPIGLLGGGNKRIGEPAVLNIKLAEPATPAAPTQTAARVEVTPNTIELAAGETATVQVGVYASTPGVIQSGVSVNTTYQGSPAQVEGEQFQLAINSVHGVHVQANGSVPPGAEGDIVFTVMSPQVSGTASGTLHVKIKAATPPPPPQKLPRSFPAAAGMLKNADLGTCLTIENNQHNDGARLVMTPCGSLPQAQTFTFGSNGEIQNDGKCAVLSASRTDDDTPIVLWTCNNGGQSNEMWTFDSSSRLIGREFQKCMEPNGSDPAAHAAILRPCWDGANQKWSVEEPPPPRLARNFPASDGVLRNAQYNTCLTAPLSGGDGEQMVMADCGSAVDRQKFTFGPNGELQVGGKCAVVEANNFDDNSRVVLYRCNNAGQKNEMWTVDAQSRLIGREFGKCLEPNEGAADHGAILRPCWDGPNQKWNVEAAVAQAPVQQANGVEFDDLIISENGGGGINPPLTIRAGRKTKLSFYGKAEGATKTSSSDVVVAVNVAVDGEGLTVQPAEFPLRLERLLPAKGGPCCPIKAGTEPAIEVSAGDQPGSVTLRVTSVAPDGTTRTQLLPVTITAAPGAVARRGSDRPSVEIGGVNRPGESGGELPGEPADPNAPLPQPVDVNVSSFDDAMQQVRTQNMDIEGLADALQGSEPVFPDDTEALQAAFERAYEATIEAAPTIGADFQNETASLAPVDAAVVARMIEVAGLTRQQPRYADASLAMLPFYMEDVAGLYRSTQRTNWKQLNTVERVIQQLKAGRAASNAAAVTDLANKLCDVIQAGLDTLPPGVDLEPHIKAFEATAAAISVADAAAKAVKWLFPNKIVALYTVINGQKRPKGSAPIDLKVGQRADVKFYMVTQTPNEQVMSPYGLAKLIINRVTKMKKYQAWLSKLPLAKQVHFADAAWFMKGFDKRLGQVWAPLYGLHFDEHAEVWKLPSRRSGEIEIDTASVLEMHVICRDGAVVTQNCPQRRIEFGTMATGPKTSRFYVNALSAGIGGYFFALKPELRSQITMDEVSGTSFVRQAEVNVIDPNAPGKGGYGKTCTTPDGQGGIIGTDGKCYPPD